MTKEEREVMRMALKFVASISPAFICEATHHAKKDRHGIGETCPHVATQKLTYEAIEKCLANDALEKKAENARELGLDYEPCGLECDCTDVCKQDNYKALWQQMCERCDELDKRLAQQVEPVAFASHGVVNWIADKQFQHEADLYTSPPQRKPPQFPTMLRKMWSGSEVQDWINENWNKG